MRYPPDHYTQRDLNESSWPDKVPAWWNVDCQPTRRRAFMRDREGRIKLVRDNKLLRVASQLL